MLHLYLQMMLHCGAGDTNHAETAQKHVVKNPASQTAHRARTVNRDIQRKYRLGFALHRRSEDFCRGFKGIDGLAAKYGWPGPGVRLADHVVPTAVEASPVHRLGRLPIEVEGKDATPSWFREPGKKGTMGPADHEQSISIDDLLHEADRPRLHARIPP